MKVYQVGGTVRDTLLGEDPKDYDYVVVGATEERMEEDFEPIHVGNNEQVVYLDTQGIIHEREVGEEAAEISLARKEVSTGNGHNDFEYVTEGVTIEEDLRRRDLTINAMASDPETGAIIDPYNGHQDLKNNVARHVSEKFVEDPIRVLRIARFAARFNLRVHPDTLELAREIAPQIEDEPKERIRDELIKTLKQADVPRRFFDVLRDCNALTHTFPLIDLSIGVNIDSSEYHQEGDLYTHIMLVLEQAHRIKPNNVDLLLAALTHDLGKVKAYNDEYPDSRMHDNYDDYVVTCFAESLKMTNHHQQVVRDAVTQHMRIHTFVNEPSGEMNIKKKFDIVEQFNNHKKGLDIGALLDLADADCKGRVPQNQFERELFEQEVEKVQKSIDAIDGHLVIQDRGWMEDGELTKSGEVVGDAIHQERIKHYNNEVMVVDDQMMHIGDSLKIHEDEQTYIDEVLDIECGVVFTSGYEIPNDDVEFEKVKYIVKTEDNEVEFKNKENMESFIQHTNKEIVEKGVKQ